MRISNMRFRLWFAGSVPLLAAMLAVALLPLGCGGSDKSKATTHNSKVQEDPWLKAVIALRQESDAAACRRILGELNQGLASAPANSQAKLGDAEALAIQSTLNLTDAEMKEIRSSGYTSLDPNHLADELYLRDVARSLDAAKLPVAERARTAFDWVCRQVVLDPWTSPAGPGRLQPNPPLPPAYVLRRGWGSGLERMFVFVAICRQLEIDACLIGPAEAAKQEMLFQQPGPVVAFPRGPFWGVGVRDGSDILIFDPWKEQALPGKNGRPATLADVRANPRDLAVWLDNKDFAWTTTADDLKAGEIFLVASISSVTPRMKLLEDKLATDLGVKLYINLAETKKRVENAAKSIPVRYYSPPEQFGPARALNSFLLAAEGGIAVDSPEVPSLYLSYVFDQLTKAKLFSIPEDIEYSEPKNRFKQRAADMFGASFLGNPSPRERLQRGQFVEVTRSLVKLKDYFGGFENQLRSADAVALNAATREWISQLNSLYDQLNGAAAADKGTIRALIDDHCKPSSTILNSILVAAVARPGMAEATFLIALTKHEQAERAGARAGRSAAVAETDPAKKATAEKAAAVAKASAAETWAEARDWWGRYEPFVAYQNDSYPGRAALAKRLTEKATALAAK